MTKYKMVIEYVGTAFKGWQKQGNTENTIQGKIEKSVSIFLGKTSETEYKIQEEEIEECGWYNYSEALQVLNYENDKYILNEAESFFASKSC